MPSISEFPVIIFAGPLFGALVLPFLRRKLAFLIHPVALVSVAIGLWAAVNTIVHVMATGEAVQHRFGGWQPPWGIEFRVDHLSAIMAVLITGLSFVVLVFAHRALEEKLHSRKHVFYTLYLLFTVGLSGMVLTADLFNLYVFLEVSALSGYAIVAVGDDDAPLAAFRYLILGSLAAGFYLIGLAYLYGVTGSLNYSDVAERLTSVPHTRTVFVAMTFMALGFAIKAALFPMHAWLPDSYAFAPNVTTALMAAVGTKVAAYGVFRVLYTVFDVPGQGDTLVTGVMGWLAGIAIIGGSLLAIAQNDLKRMLAYSSVSQIAYVLLGFSLQNAAGITGGVLHTINHAVMKCCLFLVAGTIMHRLGHRDIRQFTGLGRRMPLTMAAFTVAALSMVGLPPMAGFFSKWYLILGALDAERWSFVAIIMGSSLLNAIYFFRLIERIYLREPDGDTGHVSVPATMMAPLGFTAALVLVLGLGSAPLVEHVVRFVVPAGM